MFPVDGYNFEVLDDICHPQEMGAEEVRIFFNASCLRNQSALQDRGRTDPRALNTPKRTSAAFSRGGD
jgi:hypothetical protein